MKKFTIISLILLAVTVILTVIFIAVGVTKSNNTQKPDDTVIPVTDTSAPDTAVEIPVIIPDTDNTEDIESDDEQGDLHIDVIKDNPTGQDNEPGIIGDVVIIPGIKDESEGDGE